MQKEYRNPRVSKTSNGKTIMLSKCAICGSKKSKFIKKQEASGILSSVGIRAPLNKIPVLGNIFFKKCKIVYENNAILLSKVWRKYKKHYFTVFKSYARWNNDIIKMCCM